MAEEIKAEGAGEPTALTEKEFDALSYKFGEYGHNDLPLLLGDLSTYQRYLATMDPKAEARLNDIMSNQGYMEGILRGMEPLKTIDSAYFGGEAKHRYLVGLAEKFVQRYEKRKMEKGG